MEEAPLNGNWLYFPVQDGTPSLLNHDFPIRRFCPARMEEADHGTQSWEEESTMLVDADLNTSPSSDLYVLDHHPLDAARVDEFVDSFINADAGGSYWEKDDVGCLDPLEDGGGTMANGGGDIYVDDLSFMVDVVEGDDEFDIGVSSKDSGLLADNNCDDGAEAGVDQGLLLVHSLLACAEAVGCRDAELADSLFSRLWPCVSPTGNSMQRVSYCFAVGLKARLSLLHNLGVNGNYGITADTMNGILYPSVTRKEKIEAFQLLHQTTPYIVFAFLVANEAFSVAAQGKEHLHIIDLGMEHTLQWPSLLQALGSRPEGPPKSVRITGIVNRNEETEDSLSDLESNMRQLVEIANSAGITSLEYEFVMEQLTPSLFTRENLKLREGEALFVNSIMQLHKYVKESRGSLKAILQAIKKLGPTLLAVVEQDGNHNGPFFLGRFLESLHYYSAIFDSLEASLPRGSLERAKIERCHFAGEIRNIVACEGTGRVERHERADQWRRQLGRAGFQGVGLKCMGRARMMVSMYGCEGYTLAGEKGCLLLGWEGRPIMAASAWRAHASSS